MKRIQSIILAAVLASIPCMAYSQELTNQEQFEKYIMEGVTHYKAGTSNPDEYRAAIESFQKAKTLNNIPDVTYNIARCYHMLGDCEQALKFYREYALVSTESAEKVKGYIDELSKKCNDRSAKIKITCIPENALVSIDSESPVACTGTHELKLGDHDIVAMAEQYMPEQRTVSLSADDKMTKSIVIELKRDNNAGLFPTGSDSSASATPKSAAQTASSMPRVGETISGDTSKPLGALFWSGVGAAGFGLVMTITGTALLATSNDDYTINLTEKYTERNETRYNAGAALLSIGIISATASAVLFVLDRVLPMDNNDAQAFHMVPSFALTPNSASAGLTMTF